MSRQAAASRQTDHAAASSGPAASSAGAGKRDRRLREAPGDSSSDEGEEVELTPEEKAAAARRAAQAMKSTPSLRRGYDEHPEAALDQSSAANASRTNALRETQRKLQQRVAGLHSKVASEEQQHRVEEGLPVTAAKSTAAAKAKAKQSSAFVSSAERASIANSIDMLDFPLDDFDDDALGGDSVDFGVGSGTGASSSASATSAGFSLRAEQDEEDRAFEEEELAYARLLAKESQRRVASKAALESSRAHAARENNERLASIDSESFMLRHTKEKSLSEIRTLSLANHRLHALPAILSALSGLRSLDLGANKLRSFSDQTKVNPVKKLTELRELKAQHNELSSLDSFRSCPQLQTLRIDSNCLDSLGSEGMALAENTKLQTLSASSNALRAVEIGALCASSLTSLDLSRNALTSLGFLPALTALKEVFLSHNSIRGSLPNLSKLVHLDEFHAEGNMIESMDGMGTMASLTVLNLAGNRIKKCTGVVVIPPPAAAGATSTGAAGTGSAGVANAAGKREPSKGLSTSAAAAARESAAITAATLAKASASSSAAASSAAAASLAAQKSFPLFPRLTDLLLAGNLISDIRAEFSTIYPRVETVDLRQNKIAMDPAVLAARIAGTANAAAAAAAGTERGTAGETKKPPTLHVCSIVDLSLADNPFLASAPQAPGTAATPATGRPLTPTSYRTLFASAIPSLETLDERPLPGRGEGAASSAGAVQPPALSRPGTSAGNRTPRPGSSAGFSSRPSTAGFSSRPSTAAGGLSRPTSAAGRRGGNPLMRPPSASARGRPDASASSSSLNSALSSALDSTAEDEFASSTHTLSTLGAKQDGTVRETAIQLANFKARFDALLAKSVGAIERRGLTSHRAGAAAATKEGSTIPAAEDAPVQSARSKAPSLSSADLQRARDGEHSPPRAASVASTPSASPQLSQSSRSMVAGAAALSTPRREGSFDSDRPSSAQQRRPGSASRSGATTPRQRLEQAKMFSHSVYGGDSSAADGIGAPPDASRYDDLTGELLPASLTKTRVNSAPYKTRHAKPSFTPLAGPLPALSQQQPPMTPHMDGASATSSASSSRASTPGGIAGAGSSRENASKPSTPSGGGKSSSRPKKPAATTTAPSAGGLFDSPFTEMKPVAPSRAALATAAAKAALAAAKAAGVTTAAGAAVAAPVVSQPALMMKASSSAKTLPSTRGAVPIGNSPSPAPSRSFAAAAPVVAAGPSVSANRPQVSAQSFGLVGKAVSTTPVTASLAANAAAQQAAAAATRAQGGAASNPATSATPAPQMNVRQKLLAAQLASVPPPEEIPLDGGDEEDDDDGDEGTAARSDFPDASSLESLAQRSTQDDEEEDAADSLFARPWSAHARVASARSSRPQSAAGRRAGPDSAVLEDQQAPYSSFALPQQRAAATFPAHPAAGPDLALQRQLQSQIHVSSAYAQAFAAQQALKAKAASVAAGPVVALDGGQMMRASGSSGQLLRGAGTAGGGGGAGSQTPRGSLPVSQNPFLLKSTVYSAQQ